MKLVKHKGVLVTFVIAWVFQPTFGQELPSDGDSRYCYQFTWPGEGNATECDKKDDSSPCFVPFVLTDPAYYPPNITALNEYCATVGCPEYTCSRKGGSCLRWSWYDVEDQLINYTVFCGLMSDVTFEDRKADSINEGCFINNEGSKTKEACVCSSYDYCNNAQSLCSNIILTLIITMTIALVHKL